MNYENKNEFVIKDITNDINQNSYKKECNDIGKKWMRNCPKCNKEIIYKDKYKLKTALDRNTLCIDCARFNKKFVKNTNYNKHCPKCSNIIFYPNWHLKNKEKDDFRKKEIIDFMQCDFIILRETKKGGSYLPEYIY